MNRDNHKSTQYLGALGAFLGLGLIAGAASADVLGVTTNVNLLGGLGVPREVARVSFGTTVPNQRVVITFNAECSIEGDGFGYLGGDILVDGNVIVPTNADNALCTGNHTESAADGQVSAVFMGTLRVPTVGRHVASVTLFPIPGFLGWGVDDTTLVVEK